MTLTVSAGGRESCTGLRPLLGVARGTSPACASKGVGATSTACTTSLHAVAVAIAVAVAVVAVDVATLVVDWKVICIVVVSIVILVVVGVGPRRSTKWGERSGGERQTEQERQRRRPQWRGGHCRGRMSTSKAEPVELKHGQQQQRQEQ